MENPKQNQAAPSVSIAGLLSKDLIRINLSEHRKNELIERLVQDLCKVTPMADPRLLLSELMKREAEGINTTLDSGLSLPHARINELGGLFAILGFPAVPIPGAKQTDYPIRAMFLFFSPNRPEAYGQQLQLLRSIALLFQNEFIDQLLRSSSPEEALQLIRDREISTKKN